MADMNPVSTTRSEFPAQWAHGGHTAWEHFTHEADCGIRGVGPTKADAFAHAAIALTAMVTDPGSVRPKIAIPITCWVPNDELLFVDWINALVYEMAKGRMLFSEFVVTLESDGRLRAVARGETVEPERHCPAVEIKGATMAGLRVAQEPDGQWVAQCGIDVGVTKK